MTIRFGQQPSGRRRAHAGVLRNRSKLDGSVCECPFDHRLSCQFFLAIEDKAAYFGIWDVALDQAEPSMYLLLRPFGSLHLGNEVY
jgi:hypothetical protein